VDPMPMTNAKMMPNADNEIFEYNFIIWKRNMPLTSILASPCKRLEKKDDKIYVGVPMNR
jgi:hypothetical protein